MRHRPVTNDALAIKRLRTMHMVNLIIIVLASEASPLLLALFVYDNPSPGRQEQMVSL
jgi:hypothetical protein